MEGAKKSTDGASVVLPTIAGVQGLLSTSPPTIYVGLVLTALASSGNPRAVIPNSESRTFAARPLVSIGMYKRHPGSNSGRCMRFVRRLMTHGYQNMANNGTSSHRSQYSTSGAMGTITF